MTNTAAPVTVPLDWPDYDIGLVAAVKRGFQKFATFSGRASRREFWWWTLGIALVTAVLYVPLLILVLNNPDDPTSGSAGPVVFILAALLFVFLIATIIPSLAITVRRLHDAGFSGWYFFLHFIPLIGSLIVVALCFQATSPQAARFGPPA
ncbi:MAG: DUF805 domain-containing protein [Gordonia sp. (in: high G+C Gram-positive bacteria)]|uniref:DUF805 domain-containing protein n=1 Tax=Gordonia sp. (in: high G+C Gram-positive bacteria) TaxID=84139 RepID=UPI0039E26279